MGPPAHWGLLAAAHLSVARLPLAAAAAAGLTWLALTEVVAAAVGEALLEAPAHHCRGRQVAQAPHRAAAAAAAQLLLEQLVQLAVTAALATHLTSEEPAMCTVVAVAVAPVAELLAQVVLAQAMEVVWAAQATPPTTAAAAAAAVSI